MNATLELYPASLYLDRDARCLCGACIVRAATSIRAVVESGDYELVTAGRSATYASALGRDLVCDACGKGPNR